MQATFNLISNPFHPARDRVQRALTRPLTINRIIERNGVDLTRPTICYYNGRPLLRKDWNLRIGDGDIVSFIYLPQGGGGGGGKNTLRIVLMVAIAIMAPYAVAAYGAAGGTMMGAALTTSAGALTGTGMAMAAGLTFAGNMLINALIPPPKPPSGPDRGSSPTYSLTAQGNQARLGQPIPVIYGRHLTYPDFAAMPYAEYQDNDQYLYQLLCIGQGEFEIHTNTLKIDDSLFADFPEITYEVCPPGQKVTLFPTSVVTAGEVTGQEIDTTDIVGPFTVNNASTEVNKIAVDLAFPGGLVRFNDKGRWRSHLVDVTIYAEPIDDYGVSTGPRVTLATERIWGGSPQALRKTFKYDVAPGRYKVSLQRLAPKSVDADYVDAMVWASLRGYIEGGTDIYEDVTMLAVKMKADQSLSSQSSRKINLEVTRKLPIPSWNATTQMWNWSAPQATRSPAWAIADIFRAKYGAETSDNRIDIAQLIALDQACTQRGDTFDGIFDTVSALWDAVMSVCRAMRARPFIQSGLTHFVRDQQQTLPTAVFTSRNIVKGSFRITYLMPGEETADCVDVEYLDRVIWKPRTIRCALPDSLSQKPAQIKAFGITDRNHAWREGMYMAASNKYRRKEISFETELEGHVPSLGDLIAVQSDIPEWGQGGEVVAVGGTGGRTLTLSEPPVWAEGATHYIMLRRADGSGWGPVVATPGVNPNEIVLDAGTALDFSIYIGTEMERTHYSFGRSGQVIQLARVTSIRPRSTTVQISCINEDVRVHSADGTTPPPDNLDWSLSKPSLRPILTDFNLVQSGGGMNPALTASWTAVAGASRYIIEISYDNLNWSTLGEISSTSYSFIINASEIDQPVYVRVAAFGGLLGPWVTKSITPGAVVPPPDVQGGLLTVSGKNFHFEWEAVDVAESYVLEVVAAGAVKRTIDVVDTAYDYTWETAVYDGGPWRTLTMRVKAKKGSTLSANWYEASETNAAPAAPTCTARSGVKSIGVEVSPCEETDWAGTIIWGDTTPNFTPTGLNKLFDGPGLFYMKQGITEGMYFKAAHYDTYGKDGLNVSAAAYAVPSTVAGITTVTELPLSPADVDGQNAIFLESADPDAQGIYGWDGTQWIRVGGLTPGSVGSDELADGAVDYTKLAVGAVQARNLAVKKHFLY